MGDFMASLGKLAALHNVAVLLTSETTARVTAGVGAVLVPALASSAWEGGIATRIVLFRDWVQTGDLGEDTETARERASRTRFAGVLKAGGVVLGDSHGTGSAVPFFVEKVSSWEAVAGSDD